MVFFSSVVNQKNEVLEARRSFDLPGLGSGSNPFFSDSLRTFRRLALEGSVNCVACSSVTSSNVDAIETAGLKPHLIL